MHGVFDFDEMLARGQLWVLRQAPSQLHALAYNLANFMRTLALPKEVEHWSLTTLREKLVKIGAKVVSHGRYVTFQLAEVAVPSECGAGSAEGRPTTSRGWEGGHLWPLTRAGGAAAPRPDCAMQPVRSVPSNVSSQTR